MQADHNNHLEQPFFRETSFLTSLEGKIVGVWQSLPRPISYRILATPTENNYYSLLDTQI